MIGTMLGNRYELVEKIGEGGMAEVYKAKCHVLNRFVAVKILKKEFCNDSQFVDKFKLEATAAGSLSHNNIVSIYDVGSEGDIHYIVMEYIKGKTLKQVIKENERIDIGKAIEYASQICLALDCAHRNNLVHRDIKPHNIMVTEDGTIKVTDFGIAKASNSVTITNSSKVIGSAHYFSPEQAKGSYVDCRTDIYSLGIVLYEMVTGRVPYDAESPVSVALKHIQEPVIPPKEIVGYIPDSLNKLILKAIEKEPIRRYQSAKEMLSDLTRVKNNYNCDIETNNFDDDATRVMSPINLNSISKNVKNTNRKDEIDDDDDDDEDDDEEDSKKVPRSLKNKKNNNLKLKIIGSIVLIVIIVLGGVLGSKIALGGFQNNQVVMPDIIGMNKDDAKKKITSLGLDFQIAGTENSDKPVDTIIKSNHPDGAKLKKGDEVRVTVSGGEQTTSVPDLQNKYLENAKDEIKADGFIVGKVTPQNNDDVPNGCIISQNPDPNSQAKKGAAIDLVVSSGPKNTQVIVPKLNDLSLSDAENALKNKGLNVGAENKIPTEDKNKDGKVVNQSIAAGTQVGKGATVDISYNVYTPAP